MKQQLTLNKPLEDCEIGVEKEITVLVVPTKNDESGFVATVSEIVGYEEEDDEGEEEAGKPSPKPKRPPSILRNKEMAPAMDNY